jgi:hypothetical protein
LIDLALVFLGGGRKGYGQRCERLLFRGQVTVSDLGVVDGLLQMSPLVPVEVVTLRVSYWRRRIGRQDPCRNLGKIASSQLSVSGADPHAFSFSYRLNSPSFA